MLMSSFYDHFYERVCCASIICMDICAVYLRAGKAKATELSVKIGSQSPQSVPQLGHDFQGSEVPLSRLELEITVGSASAAQENE